MTHSTRRALAAGIFFLSGATFLTGCSRIDEMVIQMDEEVWEPESTSVQIYKDGSVTETVIDKLDKDYYDSEELKALVSEAISDYNASAGPDRVAEDIEKTVIEDGRVTLVMNYASPQDYAGFNQVSFFSGSMLNAQLEGYLFYNEFHKVTDGVCQEKTISNEEPLTVKEAQVVVSDMSHIVRVPGKILYVSANADTLDEYTAVPDEGTYAPDENGLVLPSNTVYLDHSKPEADVTDIEKTYMYVIYEF